MQIQELINFLQTHHKPDDVIAASLWVMEDVFTRADEIGFKISEEEAINIIENVDSNQDATTGISWVTLEFYIHEVKYQAGEES